MRILIAEDNEKLRALIVSFLKAEGYGVDAVADGKEALTYLCSAQYDAAVLDIMMPGMSGVDVLKAYRAQGGDAPVLFLTALNAVPDRVRGLDAGADDYLTKPFALEELAARVRVLVRRRGRAADSVLTCGDLSMDTSAHTVQRGGKALTLSAREYSVLEYMLHNAGIVLSREQIEGHIYNFDYMGGSNVVDVYIRYLRKKVDDGFAQKLIHTVRGSGYILKETP